MVTSVDKYEFKLKVDEMKALVSARNYNAAAEIAETINWRKIRNLNALVLAGEVFEQVGRYEDSKEILLLAYDKSPIGRNIIYRLAEIAIKTSRFNEAQEYYDEFVDIAPHDNLKYVLKYKMTAAQGLPYKEQIKILEELKEQEYSEEWAYELAYLYHKDMQPEKCVEACDELILWFGDGIYVEKALELKMHYQPLSKPQEEKYHAFRQKRTGVIEVKPNDFFESGEIVHETVEIPSVQTNTGQYNTANLQKEIAKGMQQIHTVKMQRAHEGTVQRMEQNMTQEQTAQRSRNQPELQNMYAQQAQPELQNMYAQQAQPELQNMYAQQAQPGPQNMYTQQVQLELQKVNAQWVQPESQNMYMQQEQRDVYMQQNWQDPYMQSQIQKQSYIEPTMQEESVSSMTMEEIQAEWEKTKQEMNDALHDVSDAQKEESKERSIEKAEQLMQRLLSIMPQLAEQVAQQELAGQETDVREQQPKMQHDLEQAGNIVAGINQLLQEQIDSLQAECRQQEPSAISNVSDPTREMPQLPENMLKGKGIGAIEKVQTSGDSLRKGSSKKDDNPVMSAWKEAQPGISAIDLLQRVRMEKNSAISMEQLQAEHKAADVEQQTYLKDTETVQKNDAGTGNRAQQSEIKVPDRAQQYEAGVPSRVQQYETEVPDRSQQNDIETQDIKTKNRVQTGNSALESLRQLQAGSSALESLRQLQAGNMKMEAAEANKLSQYQEQEVYEDNMMRQQVSSEEQAYDWQIPPAETAKEAYEQQIPYEAEEAYDQQISYEKAEKAYEQQIPYEKAEKGYGQQIPYEKAEKGYGQQIPYEAEEAYDQQMLYNEEAYDRQIPYEKVKETYDQQMLQNADEQIFHTQMPEETFTHLSYQNEVLEELTQQEQAAEGAFDINVEDRKENLEYAYNQTDTEKNDLAENTSGEVNNYGRNAEPENRNQQENIFLAAKPRFLTQAQLQAESVMDGKKSTQATKEFSKEAMAAAHIENFQNSIANNSSQNIETMKRLTPEQKEIFSYFVPIAGMEAQIYDLLIGVSEHLQYEKHALSGNIIIEGISGSGKTVLIMDIIKVLQKEIKRPIGKTGKIDANALNQKDLDVLMDKISGGCLIIESAGKISRETAVRLSRCMENDHAGTLYIIEDTEEGIQKALERDSSFAAKFTEKISIPLFSSDELVEFGKAYANDLNYDIDEMGVLALYKRISAIQKLDHVTTLTEVKEIVDEAIDNAEKGVLKKVFGMLTATRANDDNYIILREKDFEES